MVSVSASMCAAARALPVTTVNTISPSADDSSAIGARAAPPRLSCVNGVTAPPVAEICHSAPARPNVMRSSTGDVVASYEGDALAS